MAAAAVSAGTRRACGGSRGERSFGARAVRRARIAFRFLTCHGFPSHEEARRIVASGDIVDIPITAYDVDLCYEMYGEPIAYVRGRMKEHAIKRSHPAPYLKAPREPQEMHFDIFEVLGQKFLLSKCFPLRLVIVSSLKKKMLFPVLSL